MSKALYEVISEAIVDGRLPEGFSLPIVEDSPGISWIDGAKDGVSVFHFGVSPLSDADRARMEQVVLLMAEEKSQEADEILEQLTKSVRALELIDSLQSYVLENRDRISPNVLVEYAVHLAAETADTEMVKTGLSLLEMINTGSVDEIRNIVRTLGLSDEFTLFAAFLMQRWPDGNAEMFQLAKKVDGWGRIHLIERIKPETPEIRQWLLREGVYNRVMKAYSALECWNKSNSEEVLKGEMTQEDFSGIRAIIEGLLDEGPMKGISALDNGPEIIKKFLRKADSFELTVEDCSAIENIRTRYEKDENNQDIVKLCQSLLNSNDYHEKTGDVNTMKNHKTITRRFLNKIRKSR